MYDQLERSYAAVWAVTQQYDVDLATASDILALQRMHELAIYRDKLETLSSQLAEQIRRIHSNESVLIISDNDEDGVASAAIMHRLIACMNPEAVDKIIHLNESFRSPAVPDFIQKMQETNRPVKQVFALDRAFPLAEPGQSHIAWVAERCQVTMVNNHDLPETLIETQSNTTNEAVVRPMFKPKDLGILHISPQTLQSILPADQFPTAMILKEIATLLLRDEKVQNQIAWQAAVGCCLDTTIENTNEWRLFYCRFNPDRTLEAARALRLITRSGAYLKAIEALLGVDRPDQLETHEIWEQFMSAYRLLNERVLVLVERILLENRGRSFAAHFFTQDEVASPTPIAGDKNHELDFYHWISELLTQRADWSEKPIIVGQVVTDFRGCKRLGVRIRSPRGVNLMNVGLPDGFTSGGLPNTAIARLPLESKLSPQTIFQNLVDQIWEKTITTPATEMREDSDPIGA